MKEYRQIKKGLLNSWRAIETPAVWNPERLCGCISPASGKKELCRGTFITVFYVFGRFNSTVCSSSEVKSCK